MKSLFPWLAKINVMKIPPKSALPALSVSGRALRQSLSNLSVPISRNFYDSGVMY
jgi:hypothetical protein